MSKTITVEKAIGCMNKKMAEREKKTKKVFSFGEYLEVMRQDSGSVFRRAPEILRDLVLEKAVKRPENNPDDPESIGYTGYDLSELLEKGHSQPFFASIAFSHILVEEIQGMAKALQNRIYVFEGPHGCGKSTFLRNLLDQYQEYVNRNPMFEVFWKIEKEHIEALRSKTCSISCGIGSKEAKKEEDIIGDCLEIPCPGHDRPILVIPKRYRAGFLEKVITDDEWKKKIFNSKRYEWVLNSDACPICQSLFNALYDKFDRNLEKVLEMLRARYYIFNRAMGQGIKVLRSGDEPSKKNTVTNEMLQQRITNLFGDSHLVRYRFSKQAQANNGVIVLEDIKNHNVSRFIGCHNLVSEGAQSVGEDVEEEINCLFVALMNPEDKDEIKNWASLEDRITNIDVLYPTDIETEVEIYRSIFEKDVEKNFMPGMLDYFAKVVISTRLPKEASSKTDLKGFIAKNEFAGDYSNYCDIDGLIFLMSISRGNLPDWVFEKHKSRFKAKIRRKIVDILTLESGKEGYSVRDSISMLNNFISFHSRVKGHLVDIEDVLSFFKKFQKTTRDHIPQNFLDSLERIYNHEVTEQMKEALFYYNAEQIDKNIKQYLFAINFFNDNTKHVCPYTGEEIESTEEFLSPIEGWLFGEITKSERYGFRLAIQKEYAEKTLTQELGVEKKKIEETELYGELMESYTGNLKTGALEPWVESENFRRAVKDFGKQSFNSHGTRVKEYVNLMMEKLTGEKFRYTPEGAKKIALYVLDLYRKK